MSESGGESRPAHSPSPVAKTVYDQGLQLMMIFRKDAERAFEALGLSPLKAMVLHLIGQGAAHPKELTRVLEAPPSAVSVLLGYLEERGWLRREADPADRRRVRLELTPAGLAMLDRVEAAWYESYSRRLAALSSAELEQLCAIQQRLIEAP